MEILYVSVIIYSRVAAVELQCRSEDPRQIQQIAVIVIYAAGNRRMAGAVCFL
jgi:hypothetical protein